MISQDMNRMLRACKLFFPVARGLLLGGMWMLLSVSAVLAQDRDHGQEAQAGEEATSSQAGQAAAEAPFKSRRIPAGAGPAETKKGFTLKSPRLAPDLDIHAWSKHLASKFRPRATHRTNPITLVVVGFFMVFFWMLILIGALIAVNATGSYGLVLLAILLFPSLITGLVLLLWGVIAGAQ